MARYGDEFYGLSLYGTDTLVDFDVSPFSASSVDYNKILISWATPTGDWDKLRLVRNGFGFPVTPDDGDLLFEGTPSSDEQSYVDQGQVPNNSGLIEGRTYYYTMFVREATTLKWFTAGNALGVSVKNYGTAALMYEYLPAVYRIGNPFSAEDNSSEINSDLFNFLQIFAFEYDLFKTTTENMKNRYDPLTLDGRLIPALLSQFGFAFESEIGLQQARILLKNAVKIYSERGSLSGIKTFVTAFTGYNADILPTRNLMLDYNNSSFREAIGFWQNDSNTTLSRGTVESETPLVAPYAEPDSPSNFPNSQVGFLKAVAIAAADMVFSCGKSAPLTRGIPVKAGTTYVFSVYARAKTTGRTITTNFYWYDRFGNQIGAAGESSTTNSVGVWSRSTGTTGAAPENAYYAVPEIRIEGCALGEVHYIDAVQFEEGSEPKVFADARRIDVVLRANRINQVLNPSFENGISNWIALGAAVSQASGGAVDRSLYSAKLVSDNDEEMTLIASAKVPVVAGDQNAFSAYVRGTPGVVAKLNIAWYDQSGTYLNIISSSEEITFTDIDTWIRLEIAAIAPEEAVNAQLSVFFAPQAIGDEAYVDAVLFEKAAFVVPYFDGNSGYQELGDLVWENGDPNSGRSHYYKNRDVTVKRLFNILGDYVPSGSPWAVFVAQPD